MGRLLSSSTLCSIRAKNLGKLAKLSNNQACTAISVTTWPRGLYALLEVFSGGRHFFLVCAAASRFRGIASQPSNSAKIRDQRYRRVSPIRAGILVSPQHWPRITPEMVFCVPTLRPPLAPLGPFVSLFRFRHSSRLFKSRFTEGLGYGSAWRR
jgi:hypothetical protein